MRWVTEKQESPKHGNTRCRFKFAWKRTEVGRFTVWLESYEIRERFFQPSSGGPGWWMEFERRTRDYY